MYTIRTISAALVITCGLSTLATANWGPWQGQSNQQSYPQYPAFGQQGTLQDYGTPPTMFRQGSGGGYNQGQLLGGSSANFQAYQQYEGGGFGSSPLGVGPEESQNINNWFNSPEYQNWNRGLNQGNTQPTQPGFTFQVAPGDFGGFN